MWVAVSRAAELPAEAAPSMQPQSGLVQAPDKAWSQQPDSPPNAAAVGTGRLGGAAAHARACGRTHLRKDVAELLGHALKGALNGLVLARIQRVDQLPDFLVAAVVLLQADGHRSWACAGWDV